MSPASQGALEVERYIGSCLISSNIRAGLHGKPAVCRKQEQSTIRGKTRGCYNNGQGYPLSSEQQCQQVQYGPGGWTGAPLISMTSSPRRCNQRSSPSLAQQQQQQQQATCTDQSQVATSGGGHPHKSPLSRLAIHTQGAPLILAGRFYNRGKVQHSGSNNSGGPNAIASTICGGNVAGNYVHNSANPSMTSNVNSATTRCPTSRIAAQRPTTEAVASKKPPTAANNPKASSDCSSGAGKENAGSSSVANIDSLSIASDESSGSNNSENSLPRIIKPRKRRKKDRKPPNNVVAGGVVDVVAAKPDEQQQRQPPLSGCVIGDVGPQATSNVGGPKTYNNAPTTCYEPRIYEAAAAPPPPHLRNYRRPPIGHRENAYGVCRTPSMQETADVRQRYAHHRHAQVKVLDDNRNVLAPMRGAAPPKGYRHHHHHHHATAGIVNCNGNNLPRRYVHEYDDGSAATASSCEAALRDGLGVCQCRYCDPSGLIWEVDRNGYSPFLATPPASGVEYCRGHFGQMPLFLTPPPSLQRQERALDRLFDEHPRSPRDDVRDSQGGGVVLRRSWSDPTSYFSYEEIATPTRDVGVIGDRGQSESGKRRTLWRGDSIGAPANSSSSSSSSSPSMNAGPNAVAASPPKGLEVSTEIITSPNGHRDLEIKFYSSPSPCAPSVEREEDKSSSHAEEVDDDADDDFSDIWSYHESKLQQDFRTLLQAEE